MIEQYYPGRGHHDGIERCAHIALGDVDPSGRNLLVYKRFSVACSPGYSRDLEMVHFFDIEPPSALKRHSTPGVSLTDWGSQIFMSRYGVRGDLGDRSKQSLTAVVPEDLEAVGIHRHAPAGRGSCSTWYTA